MSNPLAIVTGGGSGIGLAITEYLIKTHNFRVAIFEIDQERGKGEAARLAADEDRCRFYHVDVADYDQQANSFKQAFEWAGNRLDVFFANAGIADTDSIYREVTPPDESTGLPRPLNLKVLDVDLNAVIQGVHLARHFFARNATPGGKIVITSSCLGVYANHSVPLYSTAKHALVGLVRSAAPVYAGMNITINALLPVLVDSKIWPDFAQSMIDPKQLTPQSTVCKAVEKFLSDGTMTGQTVELALEQLVFREEQKYTIDNARWMCENHELFETAAAPLLPNPPGKNYVKLA